MPVALLIPLITTFGPFLVAGAKKIFKTEEIQDDQARASVHTALPIAIGILASAASCVAGCTGDGCGSLKNWADCLMAGLAGGAGAAYLRDFDKNVLGIAESIAKIYGKKDGQPPAA